MKDCPLLRKKLKKIYKVGISTFVTGDVSLVFRASAVLKAQFPGQPRLLEAPGFSHGEYITNRLIDIQRGISRMLHFLKIIRKLQNYRLC